MNAFLFFYALPMLYFSFLLFPKHTIYSPHHKPPQTDTTKHVLRYLNLGVGWAWALQVRENGMPAATVTALMVPLATANLGAELPIGSTRRWQKQTMPKAKGETKLR